MTRLSSAKSTHYFRTFLGKPPLTSCSQRNSPPTKKMVTYQDAYKSACTNNSFQLRPSTESSRQIQIDHAMMASGGDSIPMRKYASQIELRNKDLVLQPTDHESVLIASPKQQQFRINPLPSILASVKQSSQEGPCTKRMQSLEDLMVKCEI